MRKNDGISFPIDLEVLGDIDGNGYPELAALGSEGNKVKLKDAIEQQWLNTVPFTNRYVPVDLEIYPDLDGDEPARAGHARRAQISRQGRQARSA